MLEGNSKAIQQVLGVSRCEWGAIVEGQEVSIGLGVVLDGLNNVTEAILLQSLLCFHNMDIADWDSDVLEAALIDVSGVHWVAHQSLVVWNWPGWGGHHSQRMVVIWINRPEHSALRGESSLHLYTV